MPAREGHVPTTAEIQAFGLGKLDPQRAGEVEGYLAEHPELAPVLAATPDDEVVQHLRGAGELPVTGARSPLLRLAVEAVVPVLGGCAGVLAGGAEGGLAGVVVGQVAEKAINLFGQHIVKRWLEWLRGKPRGVQVAALAQLAEVLPEVARNEVAAALQEQAPQASPADRQVAIDYLGAIPRSVRRSLLTDCAAAGRILPPTVSADDSLSLLRLLPVDLPPYSAPTALAGTDYRLEELIGTGGFGAVYRASSPSLQYLPLAIKFCLDRALLPALHQERANLERLMKAGGETWSPHLVRLYGYDLEHATPYLVYEYVPGGDLVHWLAAHQAGKGRGLTAGEVLALILQITEALAFAHERGLVHRDLKPANVLMGEGTIKLADFGIGGLVARHASRASRIGTVAASRLSPADQASLFRGAGTPLYMSGEQRRGAAPDPRQDLYSLGVMWYQLLVGDVTREMSHGWADELVEEHAVPAGHVEAINRCIGLLKHRPENAGKLLEVLRGLREGPGEKPEKAKVRREEPEKDLPGGEAQALREEVVRAILAVVKWTPMAPWSVFALISFVMLAIGFLSMTVMLLINPPSTSGPLAGCAIGSLLFAALAVAVLRSVIRAHQSHNRRTEDVLIQAIDSARKALSLPVVAFDHDDRKSLCAAGWQLVSEIQKRHLKRNTVAQVHLAGTVPLSTHPSIRVLLDGEFLGEGNPVAGFVLPATLCRGLHYLQVSGAYQTGISFAIARDGNCRVEAKVLGGIKEVEVLWPYSE